MEEEQGLVSHGVEGGSLKFKQTSSTTTKLEMSVDEVIEEYVGTFGFSQLLHVFFVSLAWIFDSQNTLITIFTDAQPSWTCKGGCNQGDSSSSMCGMRPGTWEWVDGNGSSTIAEWGLVCDYKFLAGLPAALFFLGSLLGSVFYGYVADQHLGRKKALLLSCLLASLTSFFTSLSPNIWIYALFRFLNGFSRSGIGICCIVLSTEAVGRKWRGQVGQYGFFFFTLGFLSLPIIAYPARTNWRSIYIVIALLPLIYSVTILPFVSESPRWLVVKGRANEAMEILNKLARLNGRIIPKNVILSIPSSKPNSVTKTIWSTKWATKRMVILMIAGFGVGFVYYGVQLNVENLDFNLYFTVAMNALMEIPAVFVGGVLLSLMDRRLLLISSAYIAAVSCILCIFFARKTSDKDESQGSWAQLTAEAIGFMAISTTFDVLYIYCIELFPTNARNLAVSLLRQALMLGASLAPLLVVLGRVSASVSFLVFGGLATFSGLLIFWLPETRNCPLYETLEQQEEEEEKQDEVCEYEVELGKM
ncbi:hypothetical protein ACHQM5_005229 [Ranunculus cassubicifolius]